MCLVDLDEVLAAPPEVVVFGTGAQGLVKVLPEAREALARAGVTILEQPTREACATFNRLGQEGRQVVAALHLTC